MAHKCPNCSEEVPGVVPQSTLESRLDAKNTEIGLLRVKLTESTDKAGRFDAVELDRSRLATELVELREGTSRRDALLELGVADASVAGSFSALFESATAGLEGEARPTFDSWLEAETGARANPLLAGFFAGNDGSGDPSDPPSNGSPSTPTTHTRPTPTFPAPNTHANPNPPASTPKLSAGQLRAMFQGMSVDEVRAWQESNGTSQGWRPPPTVPTA